MSRYQFTLEPVREIRRQTLTAQQQRLAEAFAAEQAVLAQIATVRQELAELQYYLREATAQAAIDVTRVLESHRYEMVLKSRIASLEAQLEQVRVETEKRRQAAIEADREVRVLDKLDERQHDEFRDVEARREQRELDEMATRRAALARRRLHVLRQEPAVT